MAELFKDSFGEVVTSRVPNPKGFYPNLPRISREAHKGDVSQRDLILGNLGLNTKIDETITKQEIFNKIISRK